jgi:hypothetical protein
MEARRRWSEADDEVAELARECDCGATATVIRSSVREGVVDRRLRCGCGRTWRQIIVD